MVEELEEGGLEFPLKQITLEAAQVDDPDAELGSFIEEEIESVEFGRIAAQTAKQVIIQRLREAERETTYEEYKDKVGEILTGTVQNPHGISRH